jgi:hypothetical protein
LWKVSWNRFFAAKLKRGEFLPVLSAYEQIPDGDLSGKGSNSILSAPQEAPRKGRCEKFQSLRAMSMTKNERRQATIPHQDTRNLNSPAWFSSPRRKQYQKETVGLCRKYGDSVMELRVQLKVCEGCGCLWYRAQSALASVYCNGCETKLKDFPTPESRKRRGRPCRKPVARAWGMSEAMGGIR